MDKINNYWSNKRVLVTGHTGFKGMWLSIVLARMGAHVIGVSKGDLTDKHLYKSIDSSRIFHAEQFIDIRNHDHIVNFIANTDPAVIFHLAAQPLVRASYVDPVETFETNILGTINVLDGVRKTTNTSKVICVTSDKCYKNVEQIWGYREGDPLGGDDPYSASKGAAEIVAQSMWKSFLKEKKVSMATVRAGNVIGGGDYSSDRIMTDIVNAYTNNGRLTLRNPNATRPWQHVLEPIFAYMLLASEYLGKPKTSFSSFNIGPENENIKTVKNLAEKVTDMWDLTIEKDAPATGQPHEATLLSLDNSKIKNETSWTPRWEFEETVQKTLNWYRLFNQGDDALKLCEADLSDYLEKG
jgi:CDP-glucose 4,6-dehydratase